MSDSAEAYNNLGNGLAAERRWAEAIAAYSRAIELRPPFVEALFNAGIAYHAIGNYRSAIEAFEQAIRNRPDWVMAILNLGNVWKDFGDLDAAARCYEQAAAVDQNAFEPFYNLGVVRQQQGQLKEAEQAFRRVIELNPKLAKAYNNLGCIYNSCGDFHSAVSVLRQALECDPDDLSIHLNLGAALQAIGDVEAAATIFRQARRIDSMAATPALVFAMQQICDWEDIDSLSHEVIATVDDPNTLELSPTLVPFHFIGLPVATRPEQQLRCAQLWSQRFHEPPTPYYISRRALAPVANQAHRFHEPPKPDHISRRALAPVASQSRRLRIGYLSADFCVHAIGFMVAELFEEHDRQRFEVFGYSIGPDDKSSIRQRIIQAFDHFRNLRDCSFSNAARAIAEDGIDILIDLQGHTRNARTEILAYRPAPIQVNYLGYPGSMGTRFIDYVLVDNFIVPVDQQRFFSETLVHLPGSYQVNDSRLDISKRTPTRNACGLPKNGLVLCSFNHQYKVTTKIFDVWLRVMRAVPETVLWIAESNPTATKEWFQRAHNAEVNTDRIVVAPQIPMAEHAARHRLADLALDTFPYNGHATTSLALRSVVPVITLAGTAMASRVTGSLLKAVGLPELITDSFESYESMLLRVARDRSMLASFRNRLSENLPDNPLYSGCAFARKVEEAYHWMRTS